MNFTKHFGGNHGNTEDNFLMLLNINNMLFFLTIQNLLV